MKPIIPPKYDIGIILDNSDSSLLAGLEPWCSNIYIKPNLIKSYVEVEQQNTTINLSERVLPYDNEKNNSILVTVNGAKFTQQDYDIIEKLSEIVEDSGDIGEFELGNLKIEIFNLKTLKVK